LETSTIFTTHDGHHRHFFCRIEKVNTLQLFITTKRTRMTGTTNPPSPSLSMAERNKTVSADLASFSRVSHRLAMVDTTEILQQVLDKLLPRLLHRVGENHQTQMDVKRMDTTTLSPTDQQQYKYLLDSLEKVHAKLIEMLSHAMKRVRHDDKCKLPCRAVLDLLLVTTVRKEESAPDQKPIPPVVPQVPKAAHNVDPFTLNLTLAFLTMGVPRCDTQALEDLLPGLLVLVGHHSGRVDTLQSPSRKTQWHQLTHLLLRAIENIVQADKDSSAKRNPYATTNGTTASSTNKRLKPSHDTNSNSNQAESPAATSSLDMAHSVLQQDVQAAGAFYNLMLDVLMYQTVAGNVPPPGLSQAGHDCLRQGVSATARDWGAEMATRGKLVQIKTQILDFVSPNRRWALFLPSIGTSSDSSSSHDSNHSSLSLGMARTVALLVIASGDGTPEVSQLATAYLKQHMDSILRSGGGTTSYSTFNKNDASVFGNAIALVTELLTLCVGASNAELTLSKKSPTADEDSMPSLGLQATASSSSSTSTETSQLMLSLKRRMISEAAFSALAAFVAKVLDDSPQLLAPSTSSSSSLSSSYTERVRTVGTLAVLAAHKSLSNLKTASGLTVLRGKPFIAAAQLLNALVIRLSTLPLESGNHNEANSTSYSMSNVVLPLMAKSLSTACQVLSTVSTPRSSVASTAATTGNNSEGNVAVRDALYGVICSLSRSSIVLQAKSAVDSYFLFALGNSHVQESRSLTVSMDTASLLFGCASNEEETLRPRALAALDALLAAYCRVYTKTGPQKNGSSTTDTIYQGDGMEVDGVTESTTNTEPANPWSQMTTATPLPLCLPSESKAIQAQLASALLPLIWTASRNSQSKASRVAAARWASDLLKEIDLPNASHLLCFIAGDPDVTAAAIAKEGLGFKLTSAPSKDGAAKAAATENGDDKSGIVLPDFGELTALLFAKNHEGDQNYYWRPTYWDFSPQGKSAAVKFSMEALLNDLYGGEDESVEKYVSAITGTLSEIATFGREYHELLDECAICLSTCLSTSAYARTLLLSVNDTNKVASLGLKELDDLALTANSSRARRFLAESCGYLYEDKTFWHQNQLSTEWMQAIQRAMTACAKELKESRQRNGVVGHIHGAAFLGATCVRAFRLSPGYHVGADDALAKNCWELACTILGALGDGTLHADDIICNSFSDGLAIALSYTSDDAPILDPQLYPGTTAALIKLWKSIQKYGNGDNANAPRASKLAHAAGICLAASTSGAGFDGSGTTASVVVDEVVYHLGPARLLCVEALFSLLGSMAYRKDEEIALVAGEALASYADAFSPKDAVWSSQTEQWPDNLNEEFAKELPPHEQVSYVPF
jgi:proteasome component ECM29